MSHYRHARPENYSRVFIYRVYFHIPGRQDLHLVDVDPRDRKQRKFIDPRFMAGLPIRVDRVMQCGLPDGEH